MLDADPAQPGEKRIKTPAKLKTTLNKTEVWATADKEMADIKNGSGSLNGTGSKNLAKPVDNGYIYLQSHWENQVEYRNPVITGKHIAN